MTAALQYGRPARRIPAVILERLPELAGLVAQPQGSRAWELDAPCARVGGDGWFPETGENPAMARRICATCPFDLRCLAGAVRRVEAHGIWGGATGSEIRLLRYELGLVDQRKATATHCVAGHEWAEYGTYRANGVRACRECWRLESQARRVRR